MEVKKSLSADLEGKKSTNWLIGCVLVFAAMFVAFEWTQQEVKEVETDEIFSQTFDTEMIPITEQKEKLVQPPAAAPTVAEEIKLVENDTKLTEETVQTTEETNQAVQTGAGHGDPAPAGPVGPVDEGVSDEIFTVVEVNPSFPGGDAELMKWLKKNINYPSICMENNIQGQVICSFVVNKDGSVVDIKVLRGADPYLDKEAERVLGKMPKWTPGRQRGKPVRTRFTLPVRFRLQ